MNNFDSVAGYYDKLSILVFGTAMRRAQTAHLHDIPLGRNVLILGGGTGWLLSELSAVNPTCKVWYIDASSKMISLSKRTCEIQLKKYFLSTAPKNRYQLE